MKIRKFLLIAMLIIVSYIAVGCGNQKIYEIKKEDKFSKLQEDYASKYQRSYLLEENNFIGNDNFKLTLDQSKYMYYGKLKDNKPNGEGVLLESTDEGDVYSIKYVGEFKDGRYNGEGLYYGDFKDINSELDNMGVRYLYYKGEFKDGNFSGKGNMYVPDLNIDNYDKALEIYLEKNKKVIESLSNKSENTSEPYISKMPLYDTRILESGEFKKEELNGEGTLYYSNGKIEYVGDFKKDEYWGEGILYNENGSIKYKGEFKNSKYDGKGTLYNEDGSVKYKGEWSNGDLK